MSIPVPRANASQKPLVIAERLTKVYSIDRGGLGWTRGALRRQFVHAVNGVTFYVRHGETLGLVGESGCGKSTLGRMVIRLSEPTFGRVTFDGKDLMKMAEPELRAMRSRMQIVFQDPYSSLNPRMTVRDIVAEGIEIFGLSKSRAHCDEMVSALLARVGLAPEMMNRYPHEFSGGQRQRIGIARALAVKPEFIVCDEPVSALDVSIQAQILNLLGELQEELRMSMLFISHDLRVVQWMSQRMAVMYLGRIVEMGPTSEVAQKQYHPYTRALFDAVPRAKTVARPGPVLPAVVPTALDPIKGCVYYGRCPKAQKGKCDVDTPFLDERPLGSHHRVACFFPESADPVQ